ncbi:MAG TPA: hypothetical protein PLN69_08880 [bacterium]|nr:hypothetical protein [bacterium]
MDPYIVKNFLFSTQPAILALLILLCICLAIISRKQIAEVFGSVPVRVIAALIIIAAVGGGARAFIVPQRHYVVFDEYEHLNAARNIERIHNFGYCVEGGGRECDSFEVRPYPAGHHVLLAAWMRIMGGSERSAFMYSAFAGGLSIFFMGLLVMLLSGSGAAAVWSSLLLCFLPLHLKYSAATSLEISSFLVLLVSFSAAAGAARFQSRKLMWLTFALTLYLANVRPENWIFLFFILIFFLTHAPKLLYTDAGISKDLFLLIPGLAFLLPVVAANYLGRIASPEPGWDESIAQYLTHFQTNFLPNLKYWAGSGFPFMLAPLAVAGAVQYRKKGAAAAAFWPGLFAALFVGYSAYHIGNFQSVDSDRYTLHMALPVIICSGYFLGNIRLTSGRISGIAIPVVLCIALTGSYLFSGYATLPASNRLDNEIRSIFPALRAQDEALPVMAYNPAPYAASLNRRVVNLSIIQDPAEYPEDAIYIAYDPWTGSPGRAVVEPLLKKHYDFEKTATVESESGEIQVFHIYRKGTGK